MSLLVMLQSSMVRAEARMRADGCLEPDHESRELYQVFMRAKADVDMVIASLHGANNAFHAGAAMVDEFQCVFGRDTPR